MCSKRLRARVPSANARGVAVLQAHRLAFHKPGRVDGTAKCDAVCTGDPQDRVYGVLYEIDPQQKPLLDDAEGLGSGYEQKFVSVRTDETAHDAFTYFATITDATLKPLHWYRRHVLHGAREHGLPPAYIEAIERVACIADADTAREQAELAIYR